ncbi:glycosyltransferase [Arenimonas caeni]|uniref:glycosyltransferase n=1 Tax=Arenimonas caeni TaxID=2058085 RepID=UPI000D12FDB7|nr:glycosyltransferase [Arenimonas caeni]
MRISNREAVLFISYDGLTDPLGSSQIIPYLESIVRHSSPLRVLSFEKLDRFDSQGAEIGRRLESTGIRWTPLEFTRGGKLSKIIDLIRMYLIAVTLQWRHGYSVIHCRSYQAGQVGWLLKRLFGAKMIFDMRGLWVDERVDGGLWLQRRWVDRMAYRIYKSIEVSLLTTSDHVVALTNQVVPELRRLAPKMTGKVTVIPCCADFGHFAILTPGERAVARKRLGLSPDAFLLSYLGSLGTWYMLDEMLSFFVDAAASRADVNLLVITKDWEESHWERLRALGGEAFASRVRVVSASREEVPALIGCSDVMLSFIRPTYSKIASSPTKLAEAYACGVPSICNRGVGDVDAQTEALEAGVVLDPSDSDDVRCAIERLDNIRAIGGVDLRVRANKSLDLSVAAELYRDVYRSVH